MLVRAASAQQPAARPGTLEQIGAYGFSGTSVDVEAGERRATSLDDLAELDRRIALRATRRPPASRDLRALLVAAGMYSTTPEASSATRC